MRIFPKLAFVAALAATSAFAQSYGTGGTSTERSTTTAPIVPVNPAPNAADRSNWAGASTGSAAAPDAFKPESGTSWRRDPTVFLNDDLRWRCEQLTSNDRLACLDRFRR